MARHAESAAARARHVVPMTDIRPVAINNFLNAQRIPDMQKGILQGASTGAWQEAARQTHGGEAYTTGLSPDKPVPHFSLASAAMFLLKNGPQKVAEMPQKIRESRAQKSTKTTSKPKYSPLDIFSDRRNK